MPIRTEQQYTAVVVLLLSSHYLTAQTTTSTSLIAGQAPIILRHTDRRVHKWFHPFYRACFSICPPQQREVEVRQVDCRIIVRVCSECWTLVRESYSRCTGLATLLHEPLLVGSCYSGIACDRRAPVSFSVWRMGWMGNYLLFLLSLAEARLDMVCTTTRTPVQV